MPENLNDLAVAIEKLAASQRRLEERVGALEERDGSVLATEVDSLPPVEVPEQIAELKPKDSRPTPGVAFLFGRSLLILAGAFLLRTMTDGGVLDHTLGVLLGLGYSTVLFLLTGRIARWQSVIGSTCLGLTAVLIAYPFLWETIAVLDWLPVVVGGWALCLITAVGLVIAWWRHLQFLAWAVITSALVTMVFLLFSTHADLFFAYLMLGLGAATLWLGYTRRWFASCWVVAIVTDLIILRLTLQAARLAETPHAEGALSVPGVQILALVLLFLYLGVASFRALVAGKRVRPFDIFQSVAVLLVGFGGCVRIAQSGGQGGDFLGWAALVVALAYYAVAFMFVRQRRGRGRSFFFFASLALIILVLGSRLIVDGPGRAWCWIGLGLAAAILGGHFDRVTLRAHCAIYLVLAALQTRLIGTALAAFIAQPSTPWRSLDGTGLAALAVIGVCYFILVFTQRGRGVSGPRRSPRFLVIVLALLGAGYLVVTLLIQIFTDAPPEADPAIVAVVCTFVLSITAVALAIAGRNQNLTELTWLVYPVLIATGIKLVLEDLRRGTPLTLSLAFACIGVAFLIVPRLLRKVRPALQDADPQAQAALDIIDDQ